MNSSNTALGICIANVVDGLFTALVQAGSETLTATMLLHFW